MLPPEGPNYWPRQSMCQRQQPRRHPLRRRCSPARCWCEGKLTLGSHRAPPTRVRLVRVQVTVDRGSADAEPPSNLGDGVAAPAVGTLGVVQGSGHPDPASVQGRWAAADATGGAGRGQAFQGALDDELTEELIEGAEHVELQSPGREGSTGTRSVPCRSATGRVHPRQGAFHTPVGAISATQSAKSRGLRPRARSTPSASELLRPSKNSEMSVASGSANSRGAPSPTIASANWSRVIGS